jgi:TIR domain
MKPLKDCAYTAFISYAHADDVYCFGWITHFRKELERGLGAALRGLKLPPMHLSGENGPVAGALSDELKERVAASFAMIIVVHNNYAQSDWCLRELEYFKALFGEQGLKERLYIVALSEGAIGSVTGGRTWQALVPGGEQVWMPFFSDDDRDRALEIYLGPGIVAPAFKTPFERLRADFAAKLKASAAQSTTGPTPTDTRADEPATGTGSPQPRAALLLGFVPTAAAGALSAAAASFTERGLKTRTLTQDAVFTEFAEFDAAEQLVLAFDDSPAMLTALASGGHLQLQRDAWLKKGRSVDQLHWLDLRTDTAAQPSGSAALAAGLGANALSLSALLDKLAPRRADATAPAQAVRIYIESNRHERTLWESLGARIQDKWDQVVGRIAPNRVPPLSLRARGLPVEQIDSFPTLDDADGVVLLWGKKTSEALVAQINKVETKLAPGRDTAPGIVAYLMPPQESSEPMPAWGWQVLRFDARSEATIAVVDEERDELERFLEKVYARHQQRLHQMRAAVPA